MVDDDCNLNCLLYIFLSQLKIVVNKSTQVATGGCNLAGNIGGKASRMVINSISIVTPVQFQGLLKLSEKIYQGIAL